MGYFIYSGYVGPDHHSPQDTGPCFTLTGPFTEEQVKEKLEEFNQLEWASMKKFRVIHGQELVPSAI